MSGLRPKSLLTPCANSCFPGRAELKCSPSRKTFNVWPTAEEFAHSVRKLFTGLATAAFRACMPTVTRAMAMASIPAIANTHH